MNPTIKLEIDPHRVFNLSTAAPLTAGGVRMKTTIYIVQGPEIDPSTNDHVSTVVIPSNAKVELRIVE